MHSSQTWYSGGNRACHQNAVAMGSQARYTAMIKAWSIMTDLSVYLATSVWFVLLSFFLPVSLCSTVEDSLLRIFGDTSYVMCAAESVRKLFALCCDVLYCQSCHLCCTCCTALTSWCCVEFSLLCCVELCCVLAVLYYVVLCSTMLYYTVLCCVLLLCILLCCIALSLLTDWVSSWWKRRLRALATSISESALQTQ